MSAEVLAAAFDYARLRVGGPTLSQNRSLTTSVFSSPTIPLWRPTGNFLRVIRNANFARDKHRHTKLKNSHAATTSKHLAMAIDGCSYTISATAGMLACQSEVPFLCSASYQNE